MDIWVVSTFWLWWLMVLWTLVYNYVWVPIFICLGSIPRGGVDGSYDNFMLNFLRNCLAWFHKMRLRDGKLLAPDLKESHSWPQRESLNLDKQVEYAYLVLSINRLLINIYFLPFCFWWNSDILDWSLTLVKITHSFIFFTDIYHKTKQFSSSWLKWFKNLLYLRNANSFQTIHVLITNPGLVPTIFSKAHSGGCSWYCLRFSRVIELLYTLSECRIFQKVGLPFSLPTSIHGSDRSIILARQAEQEGSYEVCEVEFGGSVGLSLSQALTFSVHL